MLKYSLKTDKSYIKGRIFDKGEAVGEHADFMLEDASGALSQIGKEIEIVTIEGLFVQPSERRKGLGSDLIKRVIEAHKDSLILLKAGALLDEFPEEPTDEQYNKLFNELKCFYEDSLGFVDANKYIGCYEYSVTYVYPNEISKEVLDFFEKCNTQKE